MAFKQHQNSRPADWWRGAVIYQIYPRSFMDANGDGIGDLAGIASRLGHVADLGVDAIWLSPFFTSPMDDFGYDVADYRDVDPMFGTLDDFKGVVDTAHGLGLAVIIDQVLSHSSDQHPWFKTSRQDRSNARADWYVWAEPKPDGTPPNNWLAAFGGAAWTFDARRQQYYLHNFLPSQPDLNFHNPEVQDAQLDTLRFWLDLGVDGFRFDVVNFYFHDAKLTDNPPMPRERVRRAYPKSYQFQKNNIEQPENLAFLERVRALMDEYPNTTTVGEIGGNNALPTMASYTAGNTRLHMAYTFDLLRSECRAADWHDTLARFKTLGDDTWPCWALSNHDVKRSASRLGASRALLGLTILCSIRGSVCIYQGEELGLPEAKLAFEDLRDPFGINFWPDQALGRDGCRTPMAWTPAVNAGFSPDEATTWLPVPEPHRALSVEQQATNPDSMLNRVRQLLKVRASSPAVRCGNEQLVPSTALPEDMFAVVRGIGRDRVLCIANLDETSRSAPLPLTSLVPDVPAWAPITLPGMPAPWFDDDGLVLPAGCATWLTEAQ